MRNRLVAPPATDEDFAGFMTKHERRLRESLTAVLGGEVGHEAAVDAWTYGWENWERVRRMENPIGYLYKVGRSRGLKAKRREQRRRPVFDQVDPVRIPDVEPALPVALASLSERQRTVVILTHCYQWAQSEIGELLGVSKSTVQNHLERGMQSLRRSIGESE